jgi:hypothetical protein
MSTAGTEGGSVSVPGRRIAGHRTPIYDNTTGQVIAHDVRLPNGQTERQAVAGTALQRQLDAAQATAAVEAAYTDEDQ